MKLYTVPLAPNPTKVMLYLAEREQHGASLPVEQVTVNTLKGKHKAPEHLARNPFGTLPVLELADSSYLRESLTIINYLEDAFPGGALRTLSPETYHQDRDLERVVELKIANPLGIYVHVKKSPIGLPPKPEKADEIEAAIEQPLNILETWLEDGRSFLAGNHVSIADFTLQSAFQFLRFIDVDLIGARDRIRAWDQRYRQTPAAKSVLRW